MHQPRSNPSHARGSGRHSSAGQQQLSQPQQHHSQSHAHSSQQHLNPSHDGRRIPTPPLAIDTHLHHQHQHQHQQLPHHQHSEQHSQLPQHAQHHHSHSQSNPNVRPSLSLLQTSESLAAELNRRRSAAELATKGIIVNGTSSTHSARVAVAQKALVRQMEKDRLNAWIGSRPSIEQLLKYKSNLIEDTMTWTRQVQHGQQPMPRNCHSMTAINVSVSQSLSFNHSVGGHSRSGSVSGTVALPSVLWLCGGYGTGSSHTELLCLRLDDPVGPVWHRPFVAGPPVIERYSHTCSAIGSKLVLFGGLDVSGEWLNELQVLDTEPDFANTNNNTNADTGSDSVSNGHYQRGVMQWSQPAVSGTPPSPRAAHSAAVIGSFIYYFGGNDGTNLFNDLFVFDLSSMTWSQIIGHTPPSDWPAPRAGHTCNVINDRVLVVFGGANVNGPVNDLWLFDTVAQTWSQPSVTGTVPTPRAGHAACTVFGSQLLVFGGGFMSEVHNDLYLFSFDSLIWQRPVDSGALPIPRAGHSMTVVNNDCLLVFGGGNADDVMNDCHLLDTSFFRRAAQRNTNSNADSVSDNNDSTITNSGLNESQSSIPVPFTDRMNEILHRWRIDDREAELSANQQLTEFSTHLNGLVLQSLHTLDHRHQHSQHSSEELRALLASIDERHSNHYRDIRDELLGFQSLLSENVRRMRDTLVEHSKLRNEALVQALHLIQQTQHTQAQTQS